MTNVVALRAGMPERVPEQPAAAIRWHEEAADLLSERADEHRWEAARLIAGEIDAGKSQTTLALEIGKSQQHVSYMARVWLKYGPHHGEIPADRTFDALYQEIKSRPELPGGSATKQSAQRRPLPVFARETGWQLRKDIERIERIVNDDRFTRNKEEVAAQLRGHLQHTVEVCQDLLDRLNEQTGV